MRSAWIISAPTPRKVAFLSSPKRSFHVESVGIGLTSFHEIIFIPTHCFASQSGSCGQQRGTGCMERAGGWARGGQALGQTDQRQPPRLPHPWGLWGPWPTPGCNECECLMLIIFLLCLRRGNNTINNKHFSFELCPVAYDFLRAVQLSLPFLTQGIKLCWDVIEMPTSKCAR